MSRGIMFLSHVFMSDCVELDESSESEYDEMVTTRIENIQISNESETEIDDDEELPDLYFTEPVGTIEVVSKEFDTIPNWFYNPDQWMKSTNLTCWWCGLVCQNHPWFIPLTKTKKLISDDGKYKESDFDMSDASLLASSKKCKEISVYKPYGIFCTPWCVMAKLNKEYDPRITNKWQCISLLKEIYKMYTKKDIDSIPEAFYPKEIMIQYCGSKNGVTPKEYRKMNYQKAIEHIN